MFYYPKDKKIFHRKIFHKISIVFKNLFQSVREIEIIIEKVLHKKVKSNVVNKKKSLVEHCVRKILSCVRKNFKLRKKN